MSVHGAHDDAADLTVPERHDRKGRPARMDIYTGFDSAWTDNPKARGAICAVGIENGQAILFHAPRLASFREAAVFIRSVRSRNGATLIAIDQSTIVPNRSGMRPVERVAASLLGWLGGGVQPSHRGRTGMFCDSAPISRFLSDLQAEEQPDVARIAADGLHIIEVFPALALASMDPAFFGRLCAPRYNPARRQTFRLEDWIKVSDVAARQAVDLGCIALAEWCAAAARTARPSKADQDRLDAALCVLIALQWRLQPRKSLLLLGDLTAGYMVLPATPAVRDRLAGPARMHDVLMDGQPAG
jgi:predicted RNase H-like nuclease